MDRQESRIFVHTVFFYITFIHTIIHHDIRRGPSPYLDSCQLSGRNLHWVPSRDLNLGPPYSKPAHYHLSYAAPSELCCTLNLYSEPIENNESRQALWKRRPINIISPICFFLHHLERDSSLETHI
jgi:hypothetical protein